MRTIILVVIALAFAVPANAQTPPQKKPDNYYYWLLTSNAVVWTAGGIESTHACLVRGTCREGNPIYGPHPSRGRMYGIAGPVIALEAYAGWYLRKTGHRKTWWIPLAIITGIECEETFRGISRLDTPRRFRLRLRR